MPKKVLIGRVIVKPNFTAKFVTWHIEGKKAPSRFQLHATFRNYLKHVIFHIAKD